MARRRTPASRTAAGPPRATDAGQAGSASPGSDDHRLDAGAITALEQFYTALPALACRGLCAASCARHVDASHAERARIAAAGVDIGAPTADGACPHGCVPEDGMLDDAGALAMLAASLEAGGHRDAGLGKLLAACMDDPTAAALMAARLLHLRRAKSLTPGG